VATAPEKDCATASPPHDDTIRGVPSASQISHPSAVLSTVGCSPSFVSLAGPTAALQFEQNHVLTLSAPVGVQARRYECPPTPSP